MPVRAPRGPCYRRSRPWNEHWRNPRWMRARRRSRLEKANMQPLDRPVWSSLTTHHAPLSVGNELARRFLPDVNLFMSARDDSAAAAAALTSLVEPGQLAFILQVPPIVMP